MSAARFERALVTGGAGFIGQHLVRALLARGVAVTVLDDLSLGRREHVPAEARFLEGDVRDPAALDAALEGVDCVFHEAARVSVRASVEHFVADADVNLMGTLRLLERMTGRGVRSAVLASSMAVYADSAQPRPVGENHPTEPLAPYGVAKLAAERYWRLLCPASGIRGAVLRTFNTYGPGQTPTPYVGVITLFVKRLLAGEPPEIFGDGEQRRDFVHVDDVVAANLAVLEAGGVEGVFNVGTGRASSVNEIAAALAALLAPGVRPRHLPARAGELRNCIADITAIRQQLGFAPRHPALDLRDVVAWWRERRG